MSRSQRDQILDFIKLLDDELLAVTREQAADMMTPTEIVDGIRVAIQCAATRFFRGEIQP